MHPDIDKTLTTWERAQGLAADIEAYGQWVRDEAKRRIGHLYPDATGPDGEKLTPIAWIWARTVESPDPSWSGHVPLVASWTLAKRPGKPKVWIEPIIDRDTTTISYVIREGGEPNHERTCTGGNGICVATGAAIPASYIKAESRAGRVGQELIAVVAEGERGRQYCSPKRSDSAPAALAQPLWKPEVVLPDQGLGFRVQAYGFDEWWKLFTSRQLVALATFSDLVADIKTRVERNAMAAGLKLTAEGSSLEDGGRDATAYGDAIATYLAFVVDKCADYWSTICTWHNSRELIRNTFGRQAIPMTWDFAECNPFSTSTGNWKAMVEWVAKAIAHMPASASHSRVLQRDARARVHESSGCVISTDPPYYDNVGYADISDFFYVWARKNLSAVWPDELSTLLTPKAEEIIADPGRHGGPTGAKHHFESGIAEFMTKRPRG